MSNEQLIAGWQVKRLEEVCDIARGGSPRPIKQFITDAEDGVNWIKISDATASTKYIYETKQRIKPEGIQRSRFVKEGDFILSNSMSFGRPYIMKTSGCIHDGWLVLSDREGVFNQDFLYYFLSSPAAYKQFNDKAAGSTVRNLNIDLVKSVEVLFPPLPEQKRIVTILDEAFAGISLAVANAEKNLANTRELFESYLNNVFTQKGDGWVEKKLGDICSIKHGFAFKSEFFSTAGDYVLLTPGSFHEKGGFRNRGKKTKYYIGGVPTDYVLNKGDFLFAMTEQAVGLLGSSMITPESNYYLHNQRLGLIQVNDEVSWDNDFFHHQFNTNYFRAAVQATASGLKVRHTSPTKLAAISISFPANILEQKKISSKLDKIQVEIQNLDETYQQKITALNELKKSILQKAFSGQLTKDCDNG